MSEVHRLPRLLTLLVASIFIATCAQHSHAPAASGFAGNPCSSGNGVANREAPIVCIDDTNAKLTVNPDPVMVWHKTPAGAPVTIQWFTKSGGGAIQFRWHKTTCVMNEVCTSGRCTAQTRSTSTGETCKYDVMLPGHDTLDPEVVVGGCCS